MFTFAFGQVVPFPKFASGVTDAPLPPRTSEGSPPESFVESGALACHTLWG